MFVRKHFIVLTITTIFNFGTTESISDWIAPHAWGRKGVVKLEKDSGDSQTETCQLQNVVLSNLLKNLFSPSNYKLATDSKHLIRDIQFIVTEDQMSYLQENEWNMNDLFTVLTKVLAQSKDSNFLARTETNFFSRFDLMFLKNPTTLFFVSCLLIIVTSYILSRFYKVHFVIIAFLLLLFMSFTFKYKECNDKLQADSMIKLIELENERDYCSMRNDNRNFFARLFVPSNLDKCKEQIRNKYQNKMELCDPLEVAIEVAAKLNFKFIEVTATKCFDLFSNLTESSGWFNTLMLAGFFMVLIIVTFKYAIISCPQYLSVLLGHNARKSHNAGELNNDNQIGNTNLISSFLKLAQDQVQLNREVLAFTRVQTTSASIENLPIDNINTESEQTANLAVSKTEIECIETEPSQTSISEENNISINPKHTDIKDSTVPRDKNESNNNNSSFEDEKSGKRIEKDLAESDEIENLHSIPEPELDNISR